jgi:hypothetical protein
MTRVEWGRFDGRRKGCLVRLPLCDKISASHRMIPGFQNRRCDAYRQIFFRFPKTVHARAEAGDANLRRRFHGAETGHDQFFSNFGAVIAAIFGDFKQEGRYGLYVRSGQFARIADEMIHKGVGFILVHF